MLLQSVLGLSLHLPLILCRSDIFGVQCSGEN